MSTETLAADPATRLRLARLVWGACLGALLGYYAVLVFLVPRELTGVDPLLAARLRGALLPFAGAATILAWFVHRGLAESANAAVREREEVGSRIVRPATLVPYVVCWALGDAIAVVGLVIGLLGGAIETATVFFLWALAILVATRPQAAHFPRPQPS